MQRVRIMRIGGFFYAVPQGVQPHLSQYFKGQVGSFQVVEACLCFLLNQHSFYICINCAIDVAPLDFAFLCARFDVSTLPPSIASLSDVFTSSCHIKPPADTLLTTNDLKIEVVADYLNKLDNKSQKD
ncbi:MAG: hypothetical protein ACLUEF_00475 [Faecalibacterium prausnitzii]